MKNFLKTLVISEVTGVLSCILYNKIEKLIVERKAKKEKEETEN